MICRLCKGDKLSKEFPEEHLTDDCIKHALLHCLRCVTAAVRDHQKCSQCGVMVTKDNVQYKQFVQILESLFPTVATGDELGATSDDESYSQIVVATLSGDSTTLHYDPDQPILSLKEIVERELKAPCQKQSLWYNEVELEESGPSNEVLTLKDYNVQPNSRIYLLVLLYAIPDKFDHVTFDLFWEYPRSGRDYLDASVLLYSGRRFVDVIDFSNKASKSCSAVNHSGDLMDDARQLGHHTIDVSIKSMPAHINKLIFTLSAWHSANISKYPNPSLRFFDAKCPTEQLCDDRMSHDAYSQAIIMCCLTNRGGGWKVFSLKKLSAGNVLNYRPLNKTILGLIEKGYI